MKKTDCNKLKKFQNATRDSLARSQNIPIFQASFLWIIVSEESCIKEEVRLEWNDKWILLLICNFGPTSLHSSLSLLIFFSGPFNLDIIQKVDKPVLSE